MTSSNEGENRMKRAVIFDMDGVLIYSERGHFLAFQEVAHDVYGLDLTHTEYESYFAGRTDAAGWVAYCAANQLPCDMPLLLERVSGAYLRHFAETVEPNWLVVGVLKELAAACVAIGITSSSTRGEVDMAIDALQLRSQVQVSVSADMVQDGKPHPAPYLLTAQLLDVAPSHLVVVEDSPAGVASAKAAGMKCIALTTTHAPESLKEADLILDVLSTPAVLGLLAATPHHETMAPEPNEVDPV